MYSATRSGLSLRIICEVEVEIKIGSSGKRGSASYWCTTRWKIATSQDKSGTGWDLIRLSDRSNEHKHKHRLLSNYPRPNGPFVRNDTENESRESKEEATVLNPAPYADLKKKGDPYDNPYDLRAVEAATE